MNLIHASRILALPIDHPGVRPGVHRYGMWRSTRCGELRRRAWDERRCLELLAQAKRAYRVRAQLLHPDHGGRAEDMVMLTLAWKWLARHLIHKAVQCRLREQKGES